jgi:hypothetical protein
MTGGIARYQVWESQLPGLVIFGWRYPTLQCCTDGCLGSHYRIADRNTEHSSPQSRVAYSIGSNPRFLDQLCPNQGLVTWHDAQLHLAKGEINTFMQPQRE